MNLKTLAFRVVILGVDLSVGHMCYGQKLGSGGAYKGMYTRLSVDL